MRKFLALALAWALLLASAALPAAAQMVTAPPAPGVCGSDYSGAANFTNTGSSLTAAGYGLTGWSCTPATNKVFATAYGSLQNAGTTNNVAIQLRCGTGTAPSQGAASTGTLVGRALALNGNASFTAFDVPWGVSGTFTTTPGTAIWCDIFDSTSTASNIILIAPAITIQGSN